MVVESHMQIPLLEYWINASTKKKKINPCQEKKIESLAGQSLSIEKNNRRKTVDRRKKQQEAYHKRRTRPSWKEKSIQSEK